MEAIEKRFGGNTETKKVQKTLLKQQFENFTASSSNGLDQIHDRLQKLRNKADLEEQSLDDLFNNLKIYETEVKQSSSTGTASQNLAFVSSSHTDSTTDSVSAAASVFTACVKLPASSLSNVDSLKEKPANFALMAFSSNSSSDNENETVFEENIKLLRIEVQLRDTALVTLRHKLVKAKQERDDLKLKLEKFQTSSKNLSDLLPSQTNKKTGLGYNSQVFTKAMFDCDNYYYLESDCESWPPSNLYDRFQPSGGYHAVPPLYTGTFMPRKLDLVFNTAPTAVWTDHLAFNVQLSPTMPEQDLSHTTRPSTPIIEDWVSDSEEESETKATYKTTIPAATHVPANPKTHSSGKRRNRKAYFVCKSVDHLIKDCDYHTKKMAQPTLRNYAYKGHHKQPVSAALPNITLTRPSHAHHVVTKFKSPIRRYITRSPSSKTSNLPLRVTAVQALVGNPQQALKDKGVTDNGCSRHMTGNMSYLSDFKELNGRYVAFGGNPKGGKITSKGKIKT
nr:ribonuclease H-like domain-containing protein [Tanacetum cinerariifolium]